MGSISGLAQWIQDPSVAVSCGLGRRCGSDPALLWLWRRLAAVAPIRPRAWELPYAVGVALNSKKKLKNKKIEAHQASPSLYTALLTDPAPCTHGQEKFQCFWLSNRD